MTKLAKIAGYCVRRYSPPVPAMTDKAVQVTVFEIDGEDSRADTTWLPRSIASNLTVSEVQEDDGTSWLLVTAEVPVWWVKKLDQRAAWEHRGLARPPMATRPC